MSIFLFATQPGMGHLNPLLTMARALNERGHTCVFVSYGPDKIKNAVVKDGFEYYPLRGSIFQIGFLFLPFTTGFVETFYAFMLFTSGLARLQSAIGAVIRQVKPDVVIADFSLPSAHVAAQANHVPFVSIFHAGLAYRGPGIPPFGSGLPIDGDWRFWGTVYRTLWFLLETYIDFKIKMLRWWLGVKTGKQGDYFWTSPWLTLVLTAEEVEAPRYTFPPRTFCIGPCMDKRRPEADFSFDDFSENKEKIYVSLGTVFNNKPHAFVRILEAFSDGTYQLVVSAGGAYEGLQTRGCDDHVLLFPRVPQIEVLERVDFVISHGGNNTVNETLTAGKPLLVMPIGGEQGDNASRVVHIGAGLRGDLEHSSSKEIRQMMDRLRDEPQFKEAAQKAAAAIAVTNGAEMGASFVEQLAKSKKPVDRPNGYPVTVTKGSEMPWDL